MELIAPKAILFDWDNTLVNTWPVIHEALHKTFAQTGHEPWTLEMVKKRVARSMRDSFPEIFGANWQEAGAIYQQNFRDIHLQRLQALENAEATLRYLHTQPVYVALVSNKKGDNLRKEVSHIGWEKYFSKVIGADDTPRDKPYPEPVLAALEGSGISAGPDVWFVGDSPVDMEVAHATGCVPVWYGELPEELLKHPFTHSAGDHGELTALMQSAFGTVKAGKVS
jgi:phosphoglycolate phosphatase